MEYAEERILKEIERERKAKNPLRKLVYKVACVCGIM